MGEIVDIRSAGRFPGKRLRGAEKSRGQSEKRDDENGQKKQKRERPLPSFLPFCPQIGIGKHFDIILGIEIAGEFSIGATAQRVIEASAGVLEISRYVLSESLPEQSLTREGDLLLTIGHHEIQSPKLLATILGSQKKFPSEPKQAKVNEQLCVRQPIRKVDSDLKGCLIGIDVIALRPKNNSVSSDDLLQFFRLSDLSLFQPWEWLSRATTAKSRSKVVDSLSDLSVPVIPREVTEVLEESAAAYEELSHDDFDVAGLLGSRNRNEFDKRLLRLRAGQHVLREAVQASNSLPYLIKTFYPFPIAFAYRSLSAVRNQALFDEFRVAEGLLAFIGSLALALSRPASSDLLKAFADFYNFSVGVWLKLGGIASKVLRSAAGSDLPDGLRLLFNGSFAEKADKLVNLRNHYFHGRIDNTQISHKISELSILLAGCLDELAFLVRFPLFRVWDDLKSDRHSSKFIYTAELYTGADPVHELRSFKDEQRIAPGLYVQTDGGPVDLFPFISIRHCPTCSQPETYFLDRRKDQTWFVKSFERGHPLEVQDVAAALSKWRGEATEPSS